METQMKIRQKYIEKNGGLENVFSTIESKDEYAKFLTKLLSTKLMGKKSISWKQKRK
jgi:DNA polymerase III delta subunit